MLVENEINNNILELNSQIEILKNNLTNYIDIQEKDIKRPNFDLLTEKLFKDNNLELKIKEKQIENTYYMKEIKKSNYLPSISLVYNYNNSIYSSNNNINNEHIIGFNVLIPFKFNSLSDIEKSKIEYLKSKKEFNIKQEEVHNYFFNNVNKLKLIEDKYVYNLKTINLYDELVKATIKENKLGFKTKNDITVLENTKKIKELNNQKLLIEKNLILSEMFSKVLE